MLERKVYISEIYRTTSNGTKLASATFTGETDSGWQTVTFTTPVAITANTIYVVSYFSPHGDFVYTNNYFTNSMANGPLTALASTANQPNGVYLNTTSSAFPNKSYLDRNYWADVIFSSTTTSTIATNAAATTITSSSFALVVKVQDNGTPLLSSQANINVNLNSANQNQPPVIINQTFSVNGNSPNGTSVGSVVASDPDAGQTLTYSILSGNTNGAFSINASTGVITVANSTALVNSSGSSNYSIFQSITSPSPSSNYIGTAPLEVGMKFSSSVNGYISGLRYYKGVGAQGTHIGNLWTSNGAKLASATFTVETASGWQTVTFTTPVAITANTIYVVSYFSPHGDFVYTNNYFTTSMANGPLTALASLQIKSTEYM